MRAFAAVCLLALAAGPALAKAPQPARPVALGMYSGRWYQLAQIAKTNHHPCPAATDDFAADAGGGYSVVVTCHAGPGPNATQQIKAKVAIVPGSGNAKFKMSFLAGLITQEYRVLDHADDDSWALMATGGGNYLWLLARRPVLDPRAHAAAVARMASLGYDVTRLASTR